MDIDGNVFVVTGGASGLGEETARMLVADGGKVVLADVNGDAVEAVAADLGCNARYVVTDVGSEESARTAFISAMEMGTLRGLVNCAGILQAEKIIGRNGPHQLATFVRAVTINLVGTFNMIRLAAEIMSASRPAPGGERGVVVNTASVAAYEGQVGQAAYAASKGGIVAMTLPIARELAQVGIRIMTVAPGIMETPMLRAARPEVRESLANQVPFPSRLGRPTEFAALVRHILVNQYLNGEVVRLDGAIRMMAR